ncbi:helix-turn-helix domain-containing protein [Streptomyces sp. MI02-7b]|uniref:helix-turn-helix domain-containing protein n=1 Tax=Streptomyces sp. MI02-7b TaxID=462941 RepID=UPI0029A6C509|nr:helix-turn-helix domain-containing protein [Streptomyces sp. MI02-7b]MDX3071304.1 helix-turn-helix domain-containing protein [Streptomyces sp. MI02-7b]
MSQSDTPHEALLLGAYLRERPEARAVVAADGRSRLVSAEAARRLSEEALDLLERRAGGMVRDGRAEGCELPLPGGGWTARLRAVQDAGEVIGAVAILTPTGDAGAPHAAVPDPRLPGLTGASRSWRSALARAVDLGRSPGTLLIAGEPGTGKTAVARAVRPDAVELDAAQATAAAAHAWVEQLSALRAPVPVLVRHLEALDAGAAALLVSLLDRFPRMPLTATSTPGEPVGGPCVDRLLGRLAARSVTLPPLRERPEDVPGLLAALSPRPAPGYPPLTWTVEARRVLERHTWPGNVAELGLIVRELADRRRAVAPVRPDELPDAVRGAAGGRRLGSLERAERDAILEALRTHGGNKARAAQALGIARATVYRKLRSYGIQGI